MGTRHDSRQTTRFGDKPKNSGYGKYDKKHPSVVPISTPVKQAKKNKNRKHTNDAHYGPKPHGGHETQTVKIDKEGNVSV